MGKIFRFAALSKLTWFRFILKGPVDLPVIIEKLCTYKICRIPEREESKRNKHFGSGAFSGKMLHVRFIEIIKLMLILG